jgi:uncharacterized protein YciI
MLHQSQKSGAIGMMRFFLRLILLGALACVPAIRAQDSTAPPAAAPAQKLHFLLKLIPPRTTFVDDMTPAEERLMQQHADYWAEQFKKGTVLIIGPVLDPKGPWGMAVLETATEEEARTLALNDPSVTAGLNKVELSPMRLFLMKK